MMFSISSAAIPWLLGGSSYTRHPRYSDEIGSTHSAENVERSSAVMVPPKLSRGLENRVCDFAFIECIAAFFRDHAQGARPCQGS